MAVVFSSLLLPLDESNARDSIVFHALIGMRSLRSQKKNASEKYPFSGSICIIFPAYFRKNTFSDHASVSGLQLQSSNPPKETGASHSLTFVKKKQWKLPGYQ